MRRLVLVLVLSALALALAPPALAGNPAASAPTGKRALAQTPSATRPDSPRLTEQRATRAVLAHPKVADWLDRYPPRPTTEATYDGKTRAWTVKAWSGEAGQIVLAKVDDASGRVTEAWTGPQVAWTMARGYEGAFGGKDINRLPVWLAFCAVFLLGLADLRRPLSLRNLDLLALLSFSFSLYAFNRGEIFWSVPLAYPPLVYLAARLVWIGVRGRPSLAPRPVWPLWVLVAAAIFLAGFRIGLNVTASNVIDVGYSGVVGAHRIANGEAPYGHFPVAEEHLKPCGPPNAEGAIRDRIQTNGRCESANEQGDTYGPVSYLAYLPGLWAFGWEGKWDGSPGGGHMPAAHATAILFDLLCLAGLVLVGLRFGGRRFAATLAFAWTAYPFTQYASSSNTNDAIVPAFLVFGFWLAARPAARGALAALSGWTKFATLIVAPLWMSYPDATRGLRSKLVYVAGFLLGTGAAFSVLLLEPDPLHAASVFYERTLEWQIARESPFSLWDWRQYHAEGIPDLHLVQRVLQVLLVAGALAAAFVPRRKSPLQLAALTGALIVGFHIVLTHWSYLYIPWFFPFAAFALLAAAPRAPAPPPVEERVDREARDLVAAG